MLTLLTAVNTLQNKVGANQDIKLQLNLVCEYYLKHYDPEGSIERVTFVVTADSTGQGFITLPDRYSAIRGAVENPTQDSPCGQPLPLRNDYYEYSVGNLGMLKGTDPMRGIIEIPRTQTDTTTYLDAGLIARRWKVPVCPTVGSQSFFTMLCKRAFEFLEDDDAIMPIENFSALTYGLEALDKRDAQDYAREKELWAMGGECLAMEKENIAGPQALGKVPVDDDFCIGSLSQEGWGWGGYGYYGDW